MLKSVVDRESFKERDEPKRKEKNSVYKHLLLYITFEILRAKVQKEKKEEKFRGE